jgi:hypothetical protein
MISPVRSRARTLALSISLVTVFAVAAPAPAAPTAAALARRAVAHGKGITAHLRPRGAALPGAGRSTSFFRDAAGPVVPTGPPSIVPRPKEMEVSPEYMTFHLTRDTTIVVADRAPDADRRAARVLQSEIQTRFGFFPIIVEARNVAAFRNVIVIGEPDSAAGGKIESFVADLPPAQPEGYTVAVSPQAVIVAGRDRQGCLWGVETIIQLFAADAGGPLIRPVIVHDWPSAHVRPAALPRRASTSSERQKWIDRGVARLKLSGVLTPEDDRTETSADDASAAIARDRGLDVIPWSATESQAADAPATDEIAGAHMAADAERLWNGAPGLLSAESPSEAFDRQWADPPSPETLRPRSGYVIDLGAALPRASADTTLAAGALLGIDNPTGAASSPLPSPLDTAPRLADGVRYRIGMAALVRGDDEGIVATPLMIALRPLPSVQSLHIVVAAARVFAPGTLVGTVTVTLGDDKTATIPLVYGKNIAAINDSMALSDGVPAWTGVGDRGQTSTLQSVEWNAADAAFVSTARRVSVTAASSGEALFVFAVTALTE